MKIIVSIIVPGLLVTGMACAQGLSQYNLYELAEGKKLEAVRRNVQPVNDGKYWGIRMSQDTSEGLALISATDFSLGSIEFDAKGKDEFQRSFVGIAFHGQNDSTYVAIYFRPFTREENHILPYLRPAFIRLFLLPYFKLSFKLTQALSSKT